MNHQVTFGLDAQSVKRQREMGLQSRRDGGSLVSRCVNYCKSHCTTSLLIFHQREGYLRQVLQCCAGIPELKIDLHTEKTHDIQTQLQYKWSQANTHANPILCNKRNPAEVAVWTCVAFYGAAASLAKKTKCNCWH